MAFDKEFQHHLHEVMVAASSQVRDEIEQHKRELIFKAQKTNNAAAIPVAYSGSSIYAFKTRVQRVIDSYFQALEDFRIPVDADTEREMLKLIGTLTNAVQPLTFPPGLQGPQLSAVQRAHAQKMARVGNQLQREAANRLRVAKVRNEQDARPAAKPPSTEKPTTRMNVSSDIETEITFISYAWESPEHKKWVLAFATAFRDNGVNVILDEWHLLAGDDMYQFMEQSVRTADFVIIICTPTYAAKSDARVGGVGYEARIITPELAQQTEQRKFIPILRSGEFSSAAPAWLSSRRGLDFTATPYSGEEFEHPLRVLHRQEIKAPPLGPKPVYAPSPAANATASGSFVPAAGLDGPGRFRAKGVPLGEKWDQHPLAPTYCEVTLADGPVVWLRVMPTQIPAKRWSSAELKTAGNRDGSWLLPFFGPEWWSLRAEDGYGMYNSFGPEHKEAFGVVFAFETGEVWSVDTYLLSNKREIDIDALIQKFVEKLPNYGGFLSRLEIAGPYRWAAGLDGVKGMRLARPDKHPFFLGSPCIADQVSVNGEFFPGDDPNAVFYPMLKTLYEKCGLSAPTAITQVGVQLSPSQSKRLNAVAYAYFEKKGTNEKINLYVRPTDTHDIYCMEVVPGEEVKGPKTDIADQFAQKRRNLAKAGYTEMNRANLSGDRQFD